ncbi:hypothetical protein F5X71_29065 [Nocardia brasiliensis]|uniref:ESX-1 secretion-associated regulator EspR n=1 Tax=Nocardia brasiliensis TaxID=37326 RepID=A0A6G9XY63_NOCBR|nr:hypothetical protein [Nocardia brasiliensis]QIS05817.1 hypothetical protein F5X71_29065 [Nocardia brasiliensis]
MTEKTDEAPSGATLTLSHKINRLFAVVHPRSAPERSTATVAAQAGGYLGREIDPAYLERLRRGEFDAALPGTAVELDVLAAIAKSFGVAADYLTTSGPMAGAIDRELELLATMRDANVSSIALRGSNVDQSILARIIESTDRD